MIYTIEYNRERLIFDELDKAANYIKNEISKLINMQVIFVVNASVTQNDNEDIKKGE